MTLKSAAILDYRPPLGGINYALDSCDISEQEMSDCLNVGFWNGTIRPRDGYYYYDKLTAGNPQTTPLTSSVQGMFGFETYDGTNWAVAISHTKAYKWIQSGASKGWNSIQGASADFTGDESNFFDFTTTYKTTENDIWMIATNGVDDVHYWTGGGADITILGGSPPKAKYCTGFKTHLLLANCIETGNEYPRRVYWSDAGDPTEWVAGNSGFFTLEGDDPITGITTLEGDIAVIFKEDSVWTCRPTGSSDTFTFQRSRRAKGCPSGRAFAACKGWLFYLGTDGNVYAFDGVSSTPMANNIQNDLRSQMNVTNIERCFMVYKRDYQEIWVWIPFGSGMRAYIGNVEYFPGGAVRWTRAEFADEVTAVALYQNQANLTIDELVGTIDEQNWRFGDRQLNSFAPIVLYGDVNGYIWRYSDVYGSDNSTAITSWFDTKDFMLHEGQGADEQYWNRLDTYYTGDTLSVYQSLDKGANYTLVKTLDAATDYDTVERARIRKRSKMMRLRYYNATADEEWVFKRSRLYWTPMRKLVNVTL